MESVSLDFTFIFGCLQVTLILILLGRALELCGTGKHPNINVKTQIPLELTTVIDSKTKASPQPAGTAK